MGNFTVYFCDTLTTHHKNGLYHLFIVQDIGIYGILIEKLVEVRDQVGPVLGYFYNRIPVNHK